MVAGAASKVQLHVHCQYPLMCIEIAKVARLRKSQNIPKISKMGGKNGKSISRKGGKIWLHAELLPTFL
eukprot:3698437-Amphidinium_carterae.1